MLQFTSFNLVYLSINYYRSELLVVSQIFVIVQTTFVFSGAQWLKVCQNLSVSQKRILQSAPPYSGQLETGPSSTRWESMLLGPFYGETERWAFLPASCVLSLSDYRCGRVLLFLLIIASLFASPLGLVNTNSIGSLGQAPRGSSLGQQLQKLGAQA